MILKCQCCGFEAEFEDGEAAFQAGWDAPPHFSTHVCCNLCPAVCVVLGKGHKIAHAIWEREGRPTEFTLAKCGLDDIMGDAKATAEVAANMGAIADAFGWPREEDQ